MIVAGLQLRTRLLKLPPRDRAQLAALLLESLSESAEDEAWEKELLRRARAVRNGTATGKPVERVLARLRKMYP
jgi:putative addiction module component (TIGR02574 family)